MRRSREAETDLDGEIPRLLTPQEVAERLRMSVADVHRLVRQGELACMQISKFKRRFDEEMLDEFLERKRRGPEFVKHLFIKTPLKF